MKLLLVSLALSLVLVFANFRKAFSEAPILQETPVSLKPVTGKILCPDRIHVRQTLVSDVKGWEHYIDSSDSGPVEYVNLFYEDPAEGEDPINSESDDVKVESPKSGMWVLCGYKETEIRVARPLDVVSKGCRYLYGGRSKDGVRPSIGAYCE